jgi:hypothetical protein
VLLAALDARRPTRDIDFAARRLANDTTLMLGVIRQIAAISFDDGLSFNAEEATGESIILKTSASEEGQATSGTGARCREPGWRPSSAYATDGNYLSFMRIKIRGTA